MTQGGDCGKALIGLPRLRPIEYARLKQREKHVNRAYGGSRCAGCVRSRKLTDNFSLVIENPQFSEVEGGVLDFFELAE